jgi:hypothetical protein
MLKQVANPINSNIQEIINGINQREEMSTRE